MPLSIKNPHTERLVRDLAATTGESITEAVTVAVEERLGRVAATGREALSRRRVEDLLEALRALPDLDGRSAEEILDYDEHGLP